MQSIRRSVFRAVTSSSVLKPRSITTSNQFLIRINRPATTIQSLNLRRWASDEAFKSKEEEQDNFSDSFADVQERSTDTFGHEIQQSATLYVGNFPFETTQEALEQEFAPFGTIKSTRVITDARGLNKGFGYIEFETAEEAAAAIEAKNQVVFDGRRLVVNYQAKKPTTFTRNLEPSKTIFIGNLAFEMSDADLNKLFRDIRNVVDVRVAIDRRTGQPRGFAHADFVDIQSAKEAMESLQGKEVFGRQLRIDFSGSPSGSPRQNSRSSDGGRGYGNRGGYGDRSGGSRGGYGGDRGGDRGGYGDRSGGSDY